MVLSSKDGKVFVSNMKMSYVFNKDNMLYIKHEHDFM